MKKMVNKISMIVVATVMFGAAMFLSMERNEQGNWEFATLNAMAQGGDGGGENGDEGNWAAEYPQCENTISIGVPPLVYNKTIRGTYRDCVSGSGSCVYSDWTCCEVRVYGICVPL